MNLNTLVKSISFDQLLVSIILNSCIYFGYQESIAIGRTFASKKDYQLDGNKEMMALGTTNIVGSMTSCYVATGKSSESQKAGS